MARILVVDDDEFFRNAIKSFLESVSHTVLEAPNGRVARDLIKVSEIDLVLSDVQMPFLDGVELLQWIKAERPMPFILMTGFTNIVETHRAHELGADGFLSKPFSNQDLVAEIKRILEKDRPKASPGPVSMDDQYCKVSIEEFVARPKIDFDVFVRLSSSKYLKIAYKGDTIQRDRVRSYQDKGVQFLHILREDFGKLVDFNLQVANMLRNNDKISAEKKMNFMKYTGEVILERCFVDGVSEESFNDAKNYFNTTINVISDSPQTIDLLTVLSEHTDHVYAHSVGVGMYAVMIARKMGHTSANTFFKLSMAGMFHDIGKKEIERELLDKPRPLLSAKERKLVETHVTRGKEILEALKTVPNDVIQMVFEHHEDNLGQGFPRAITKNQIHPLSKILIVANRFVEIALKGPHHDGMGGLAASKYLIENDEGRLDSACVEALQAIFLK